MTCPNEGEPGRATGGSDGLVSRRLDDVNGRAPSGPGVREPRPKDSVGRREGKTRAPRSMDNGELVAESADFQVQRGARLDDKSERVEQRDDDGPLQAIGAPRRDDNSRKNVRITRRTAPLATLGHLKLRRFTVAVPPACAVNCAVIVTAHDASEDTGQNCDRGIFTGNREFWPVSSEVDGIRFGLANRRLQPLGHLTVRIAKDFADLSGRTVYGRAGVPTSVPKPTRSVPQIPIADDIIAIENAARLVAAQFHRDPFGDAGADHVPDGGSTKVVRDAAGQPAAIRARHQRGRSRWARSHGRIRIRRRRLWWARHGRRCVGRSCPSDAESQV